MNLEEAESEYKRYNRAFKITCVCIVFYLIFQFKFDSKPALNYGILWFITTFGFHYYHKAKFHKIQLHYIKEIIKLKSTQQDDAYMYKQHLTTETKRNHE